MSKIRAQGTKTYKIRQGGVSMCLCVSECSVNSITSLTYERFYKSTTLDLISYSLPFLQKENRALNAYKDYEAMCFSPSSSCFFFVLFFSFSFSNVQLKQTI